MDDCSDEFVAKAMEEQIQSAEKHPNANVRIIRNEVNKGYLHSCNAGIEAGNAPYVITLNSDTYVFEEYLERFHQVFLNDETVGIINPVSTWSNLSRIPFPDGFNIFELDAITRQKVPDVVKAPDINNASGFCFAVKRALFDELGLFDVAFNPGYYEEADFCMKAIDAGHRVVVAPWIYIFHHGWGSFGQQQRNLHMERNKETFNARWGDKCDVINKNFLANNPIQKFYGEKDLWRTKDTFLQEKVPLGSKTARAIAESVALHKEESALITNYSLTEAPPCKNGKIIYLLPAIKLYGGVISVIQLVNQLILQGYDANIAVMGECDLSSMHGVPMYFRPYVFENEGDLIANLPQAELIVATQWRTAYTASVLKSLRGSKLLYFVQDYECDFHGQADTNMQEQAYRSYSLIPDKIVKSEWLETKMQDFGGRVTRIPIGLNTDVFYNRNLKRRPQVITMARITSSYRNYPQIVSVYNQLAKRVPNLELAVFGFGHNLDDFTGKINDYGMLSSPVQVSKALNESSILLDCSLWQGFGRPGLEAMATDTACVLTRAGGITQYAKHELNCLLVDPTNTEEIVEAIERLHLDESLRSSLVAEGREVAKQYSYIDEGVRTAELFLKILKK